MDFDQDFQNKNPFVKKGLDQLWWVSEFTANRECFLIGFWCLMFSVKGRTRRALTGGFRLLKDSSANVVVSPYFSYHIVGS